MRGRSNELLYDVGVLAILTFSGSMRKLIKKTIKLLTVVRGFFVNRFCGVRDSEEMQYFLRTPGLSAV